MHLCTKVTIAARPGSPQDRRSVLADESPCNCIRFDNDDDDDDDDEDDKVQGSQRASISKNWHTQYR